MSSPKEIEIKLQLPSANFAQLRRVPLLRKASTSKRSEDQVSVYFDTKRLKLKGSGLTLRVRRTGSRYIQTIKSSQMTEGRSNAANGKPPPTTAGRT